MRRKFGICASHLLYEGGNEAANEGFALVEEGVSVANCTTQDATNHITSFRVGGKLSVCDGERDGAQVVCDNAHCHVGSFFFSISKTRKLCDFVDDGLENVGVVVGVLALKHTHQTLKSHTGVDNLVGKSFERTVGFAIVLHKHEVPNFNHLGVVLIDERSSRNFGFFFFGTSIDVDF